MRSIRSMLKSAPGARRRDRTDDDARALARGRRTAAWVTDPQDWVLPWWLQREADPTGPEFTPTDPMGTRTNRGHRAWTSLAITGGDRAGMVDPRGLVVSRPQRWSLDWWVGADERWHFPSLEPGVRQELVEGAPVVETLLRVPGGDIAHRVFAARPRGSTDDHLVVEIENRSRLPVALALAIRPADLEALTEIGSINLDGGTILVDGEPAVVLDEPPPLAATSNGASGDLAAAVVAGSAVSDPDARVSCPDGLAQLAVVMPLAHGATRRVSLPLTSGFAPPLSLPASGQVAAGWQAQADRGMRVIVPDARVIAMVQTGRMHLLALYRTIADGAPLVGALDRQGFHDEAADALISLGRRFEAAASDGQADPDLAIPLLSAIGDHWWLSRDREVTKALSGVVADMATELATRPQGSTTPRALLVAAELLDVAGEPLAAQRARESAADRTPQSADDGPETTSGAAPVVLSGAGQDLLATAHAMSTEARQCLPVAADRLAWLARNGDGTGAWPASRNPRTGSGSFRSGHDPVTGAAILDAIRSLFVSETPGGVAILPVLPPDWLGQSIEVHDAPTRLGHLAFAVRWHGERPALLWELTPHDPEERAEISAPGLDRSWSTVEVSGDALLAAPEFEFSDRQGATDDQTVKVDVDTPGGADFS